MRKQQHKAEGAEQPSQQPLHVCHEHKTLAAIYRLQTLLHSIAIAALVYYRASWLFSSHPTNFKAALALSAVFASELLLSFLWLLTRSYRWRPVTRTVFPTRLPPDPELPSLDVFICTADPVKEPALNVMNTVISAMALDYPKEKLAVYLSDDGCSPRTLRALREACSFAASWLPFCEKHEVETRCPEAYFRATSDNEHVQASPEFLADHKNIKTIYESFEDSIGRDQDFGSSNDKIRINHPSVIEVVCNKGLGMNDKRTRIDGKEQDKMPMVVYVSREKKHSYPHNFKAGALNVLLRVSSILSNAPYILFLDCDMYSNDPTSARQAMCFHLDHRLSPSLAFVQFPQTFHTISKEDIYDSQLRDVFKNWWIGCDGIKGPPLSGTNFYMRREALYATALGPSSMKSLRFMEDLLQCREFVGCSNELIKSMCQKYKGNMEDRPIDDKLLLQEAQLLASCTYEEDTRWGKQIGFLYGSVVEDFLTGYIMHYGGWTSVYIDPSRPSFLGSAPISLNSFLVQHKRWATGLLEVALSRFCPLLNQSSCKSLLMRMYFGLIAFLPSYSFPVLCFGIIPPLCFLNCFSLYPKISDPLFGFFAFIGLSALCQHILEVIFTGGSLKQWWREQRLWMIKMVSPYLFGCLDLSMKLMGFKKVDFELTNKVVDSKQAERYEKGIFDFQGATIMLIPPTTIAILNLACFLGGVYQVISRGNFNEMFGEMFITFLIVSSSYPLYEGMIMRVDSGKVPYWISMSSLICSLLLICLGSVVFAQ